MESVFAFPGDWSATYTTRIERNIGLVSITDQEKIKHARIAVLGTGGLGAPLALQLVYMGAEHLVLCDRDRIELSNLNRQPYTEDDIGQMKVDVCAANLRKINPAVDLRVYYNLDANNGAEIVQNVDLVALTLDDPIGSILVAREAYKKKIPMVETWGVPYLFAWWFTADSPTYETIYQFATPAIPSEKLANDTKTMGSLYQKFYEKLMGFPAIQERYSREPHALEYLMLGKVGNRTIAPVVWMNAVYVAIEIIYAGILQSKPMVIAPTIHAYDYLTNQPVRL